MAHSCPECGMACYCGSDIDDCLFDNEEDVIACTHCVCKKCGCLPDDCGCFDHEEYDEESIDGQDEVWDCIFPGRCLMVGDHMRSECHTAEMLEDYYREHEEEA